MSELKAKGQITNDTRLVYLKSEVDKVIAELKAMAKEPAAPNRTCRNCGRVGTLMYMPIVKDGRIYWYLYNNKGIDYVFGIQCAHCGEVAFVTKQTHKYELRHQKYKRCISLAELCSCMQEQCGFLEIKKWEKREKKWREAEP